MDRELVFAPLLVAPYEPYEGLYREGIVLHGDRKFLLSRTAVKILILHELVLLGDLSRISQELLPLRRRHDAPVCADKDLDADLLLQRLYGRAQTGLCDIEALRGLIHGSAVRDREHLTELLKGHDFTPLT